MSTNIREVEEQLIGYCNSGIVKTNLVCELNGYGTVWFYPSGIENILSLYHVISKMHVEYDSWHEDEFHSIERFKAGTWGLYYYDTSEIEDTVLIMDDANLDSVASVETNKLKYTQRKINDAHTA